VGRLAEADDAPPEVLDNAVPGDDRPESSQRRPALAEQRRGAVLAALRAAGAARVVDLGCGEGDLIRLLLADRAFTEVLGVDVSPRALEIAARRLRLADLPERHRTRVRLIQSSLTYRDGRIAGYDAAVLVEVVEHVDPSRLPALERAVFGHARPGTVVVTTPNAEHNVRYTDLPAGAMRHPDHRFEWDRAQFRAWADGVAARHGYRVRYLPIGPEDSLVGPPTQMAVFTATTATGEVAAA
jgi:3' terminal RNA ribose 2'-O-methyltransferase Hen1